MFCVMKTRILYPACNATVQFECFDLIQNATQTETADKEVKKRGEQSTYIEVKD
jgi:hypothetical protein